MFKVARHTLFQPIKHVQRGAAYAIPANQACCFRSMEGRGGFDWLMSNINSLSLGLRAVPFNNVCVLFAHLSTY